MKATLAGCLLAVCLASPAGRQAAPAQGPPPERTLAVVEPAGDIPIIGPTLFRATLDPPGTPFSNVEFYVNDKPVCRVTRPPIECRADVGPRASPRTIRALARFADGSRLASSERVTPGVDLQEETGVVTIPVPAQVEDRRGNRLGNVPRSAFRLFEDGVEQSITDFRTEGVPLEIVVAVDVSDSMRDDLAMLKRAVKRFVEGVRPLDSLTVIAFNDRPYRLPPPVKTVTTNPETGLQETTGVDKGELLAQIDRLGARGGTALHQTIITAVKALHEPHYAKAVILFSDGDDTVGGVGEETVERTLVESEARLFVVVQGEESKTRRVRQLVKRLTQMSGGRAYPIDRIGELDAVLTQIALDLQTQYYLAYTPTNDKRDGTVRRIEVKLVGVEGVVHARRQYVAGTK